MATVVEHQTDADRDQRIENLEHQVEHLTQLLERMRAEQERATWERRTNNRSY